MSNPPNPFTRQTSRGGFGSTRSNGPNPFGQQQTNNNTSMPASAFFGGSSANATNNNSMATAGFGGSSNATTNTSMAAASLRGSSNAPNPFGQPHTNSSAAATGFGAPGASSQGNHRPVPNPFAPHNGPTTTPVFGTVNLNKQGNDVASLDTQLTNIHSCHPNTRYGSNSIEACLTHAFRTAQQISDIRDMEKVTRKVFDEESSHTILLETTNLLVQGRFNQNPFHIQAYQAVTAENFVGLGQTHSYQNTTYFRNIVNEFTLRFFPDHVLLHESFYLWIAETIGLYPEPSDEESVYQTSVSSQTTSKAPAHDVLANGSTLTNGTTQYSLFMSGVMAIEHAPVFTARYADQCPSACFTHAYWTAKGEPSKKWLPVDHETMSQTKTYILKKIAGLLKDGGFNSNEAHKANFATITGKTDPKDFIPISAPRRFQNAEWERNYVNEFTARCYPGMHDKSTPLSAHTWMAGNNAIALGKPKKKRAAV